MGLFLFLFLSISISLASEGPVLKENSWDKPKTAVGRAKGDNLLKGWRQGLWRFWVTFARTAEIGILSCCCFHVCFRFYVYLLLSPCGWGTRHNRRPIVVQQVWTVKSALGFDVGWLHGRTPSICMYCMHCVHTAVFNQRQSAYETHGAGCDANMQYLFKRSSHTLPESRRNLRWPEITCCMFSSCTVQCYTATQLHSSMI